jgi:hypothetical protein
MARPYPFGASIYAKGKFRCEDGQEVYSASPSRYEFALGGEGASVSIQRVWCMLLFGAVGADSLGS